jgi:exopolysaccharide biosynthesis polyprenyl glycosylphosphotransferase
MRLFRVSIPKSILVLIASEFLWMFGTLLLMGQLVMGDEFSLFLWLDDGFYRLLIVVGSTMLVLYFLDLYNTFVYPSKLLLLQTFVIALGGVLIIQSVIGYLFPGWIAPRSILLPGGLLISILFVPWRTAFVRIFMPALGTEAVLFLGANPLAQEIVRSIRERPELAIRPIGFIDDSYPAGEEIAGVKVLGKLSDLVEVVDKTRPNRIVVGMDERRQKLPVEDLLHMRFSGLHIEEAAVTFQAAFGRVPTRGLRHSQLIFSSELGPVPRNLQIQTLYSVLLAAIALVILSPVLLLVALAVRLSSRGPVLFRQTRVGIRGKNFTIYKFRSMVANAESETGAVWATRNDPRITSVGRFLRKTRLDELPQLFNVIRREMSIVGPRPERPEFVGQLSSLISFYAHRHSVKPGITGWAQINYKYGDTIEDAVVKLEYDMYYIKNLSPALDVFIMLHTFKAMLSADMGH